MKIYRICQKEKNHYEKYENEIKVEIIRGDLNQNEVLMMKIIAFKKNEEENEENLNNPENCS